VRLEELSKLKNPPQTGLEPATFQLIAYCKMQSYYNGIELSNIETGIPVDYFKTVKSNIGQNCLKNFYVSIIGSLN
jgi:hypothetical protein